MIIVLTYSSNTADVQLDLDANAAGWDFVTPVTVYATLDSGKVIYGSTTAYALYAGSNWNSGDIIYFTNNGRVAGKHGVGNTAGGNGSVGGLACDFTGIGAGVNFEYINNGDTHGGGGGGGGGQNDEGCTSFGKSCSVCCQATGGTGGNGYGLSANTSGSAGSTCGSVGGANCASQTGATGGNGGGKATAGSAGGSSTCNCSGCGACNNSAGSGGAAGAATSGISNVTYTENGTTEGTQG